MDGATFKVPEAARYARVGQAAIYNGIHAGTIPHIKFGRNILIPKAAFIRWLETCGQETAGAIPNQTSPATAQRAEARE